MGEGVSQTNGELSQQTEQQHNATAPRPDWRCSTRLHIVQTKRRWSAPLASTHKSPRGTGIKVFLILRQMFWVQIPTWPPPDYVTLGRLLQPFGCLFPGLYVGHKNRTDFTGQLLGLNEKGSYKSLWEGLITMSWHM